MLKKKYRLSFKKRIKFTKSLNSPIFTLKTVPNNLPYNRFGFIVSKKVDKRAVVRNKIKRIFRFCLQGLSLELKSGEDMLFLIRKNIVDLEKEKVYLDIRQVLNKGGFLK